MQWNLKYSAGEEFVIKNVFPIRALTAELKPLAIHAHMPAWGWAPPAQGHECPLPALWTLSLMLSVTFSITFASVYSTFSLLALSY